MQELREIADRLKGVKSALIFTHARPDGDTLGCGLALFLACKKLNIRVEILNEEPIPEKYLFLEGMSAFKTAPTIEAEAYIAVDSADEKRLGTLEELFRHGGKKAVTFNIDHHISNTSYAKYNFVRPMAANCQNIAELISLMGARADKAIADALLLGLLTDSGNFSHNDVTGDTFRTAAALMDAGADVEKLNYNMFKKQSKARAALYARTMSGMRFLLDDRLAIIVVTRKALAEAGGDKSLTEGFVDFPLSVEGVEVAVALLEVKFRQYKVSLRSKGKVNVNAVAGVYGGGGHILASGCMLFGDEEEVVDRLRYTVSQYLD